MTALSKVTRSLQTFSSDVADGFFEITHSGFALLGLALAIFAVALAARPDLRQSAEDELRGWLHARQVEVIGMPIELGAIDRATATDPRDLPKQQAAVTYWLSKKYKVAAEPLGALVAEAYEIGQRTKLDPTLILAIMAIESSFNPFAQSPVGAQGLMQVMTRVHTDKYDNFGGQFAAFDPVTNLRVGVKVLQECITRAGSVEGGLRFYVGAGNLEADGGYASKVIAEYGRLKDVAAGRTVPTWMPLSAPPATTTAVTPQNSATPPQALPVAAPDASPAAAEQIAALNVTLP